MTETTVTPDAIDALVSISSILVVDRHRRNLGNLTALADSIADVGLLNPITLTRDSRLVAGQRRLAACRLLGWTVTPVRYVDTLDDATRLLRVERDENLCREAMLPSEQVALGRRIEELERPKAAQRKRDGQVAGRAAQRGEVVAVPRTTNHKTSEAVGEVLGISASNYSRAKTLVTAAEAGDRKAAEAVKEMDRTGKITPAYNRYKGRPSAPAGGRPRTPEPEPESEFVREDSPEAVDPEDWIPPKGDRTRAAVLRRRELIREMAPRGYTSGQIGDLLGIDDGTVRRIAKAEGVDLSADRAVGRYQTRRIDSNNIIRQTIQDLSNAGAGLDLVNYDELDPTEIPEWIASLNQSIRVLNQLNRRLREAIL